MCFRYAVVVTPVVVLKVSIEEGLSMYKELLEIANIDDV